jgi:hypothetical protein
MSAEILDLQAKRKPVCYTVRLTQGWNGELAVLVEDVADDQRSRESIAAAMREGVDLIERGVPQTVKR